MKKVLSLFILAFLLLMACNKKTTTVDLSMYSEYLSSYPSQEISTGETLSFSLQKEVDVTDVSNDVISISPKVEGNVVLENNVISFVPSENFKNGEEYEITLHLSKLYNDITDDIKDFSIKLKTKELLFSVELETPRAYDKNYQYIEGQLIASDIFDASKVSEILTAKYNGKIVKIDFDKTSELASIVEFKIDSLERYDDNEELKLEWDGGIINSDSEGETSIEIVGKKNFQVLGIRTSDEEQQEIEISFSDPIDQEQDLKGLIQFVNTQKRDWRYTIEGNIVTVYPQSSFKDKVDIEIFKGIKNIDKKKLKEDYSQTVWFGQPKPSVSFIKSGSILPDSDNLKVNFHAVNLRAVDAKVYKVYKNNVLQFLQRNNLNTQANIRYVGRPIAKYTVNLSNKGLKLNKQNAFAIDLADIVKVEEGVMYRVELSFNQEYSYYSCDDVRPNNTIKYGKKEVDDEKFDEASSSNYYYDEDYYENYRWRDRDNPCTPSFYRNKKVSTNIFATNLGLIVKKGNNNKIFTVVNDILTTKPVSGAKVTLYNLQQQELVSQTTNGEGVAEFSTDKKAFFAVATFEKSTTYIRLNDGNALSMSKFDVSGAQLQKGIQGYIYGERGVWRPGDMMYLTFVLNDNANPLPNNHPIKFELIDPQGNVYDRKIQNKNPKNVYSYLSKTKQDDITGNWKLRVSVGGAKFVKDLKIETIKPNRLKIKVDLADKIIKADQNIAGEVDVKWLHGAIARGLKLDINGKFSPAKTEFEKFKNYTFDDITRNFGTEEFSVYDGKLNNDGKVNFSVKPALKNKAAGMLKASFITKVYENGGDFSTDVFSQKVSPYASYAGLNAAEEQKSKNFLFTDEEYSFNVASVDEDGKGIDNRLEVKVYKINWRWWWSTDEDGLSKYDGSNYYSPFKKEIVKTNATGKGTFKLKIGKQDWGRYLVKVRDGKSGHTTSKIVYFDWPSWYGKKRGSQDKSNATMLVFSTDKEKYEVGQKATVKFPSSLGGRALITIENGSQVIDNFWVETKDKQTEFKFPVLASYAPNVFVTISLLQKHSQTKNDLPIRMYGSVPMLVMDPNTKLEPEIKMSEDLRPETTATIDVEEKNGKPMTYTIALVDEGLLDLTRFKTPNPWDVFYARQSLGVKTWDVFDDVVGAYGGKINQILSIGGDASEAGSKNKKANRFKPMVKYYGPFTLAKGQAKSHKIKIPKYIGSIKAMVVASDVSKNAYGSVEKTAFVRKPVMILASLPRKITPNETVTLPVTVFAMKKNIKNVTVSIQPHPSFTVLGQKTQNVSFSQPDEKMVFFKLKVNDYKGIGKVKINASSGVEKTSYDVEIDVLNPNPVTTETLDLVLNANKSGTLNFNSFGTKGTNNVAIELSTLPPMNFTERLEFLIQYPHGCVEQTTSSVFPQLYFPDIFELKAAKKQKIQTNIKAAIQRLSNFQVSNGGLSYWPNGSSANDWGTSYAGHFLIEASKKGYALPIGFKQKWITYQKRAARNWRGKRYNQIAQAYRLYTLALAGSPDLASMNRLRETDNLGNEAKLRLASAYALSGKQTIAKMIIGTLSVSTNYSENDYRYYGSEIRNDAMALETYTLTNQTFRSVPLAKKIAKKLSGDRWLSTQTTAYSLIAMSKYALKNGGASGIKASYLFNSKSGTISTSKALATENIVNVLKSNTLKVTNGNKGVVFVRVFNRGILPVGQEKVMQSKLEANVNYLDKKGSVISPDALPQGTNFIATVTIKNTSGKDIKDVALTQYFPSGWEIVNTRFTSFGSSTSSSSSEYTDIRDASISNYFTLKSNQTKIFNVLVNASYLGEYYLPGIQAEAMYDNSYIVRTKGKWVKVVR